MIIIAHRGYWNDQIQPNSIEALKTALDAGYGFESDIRDYNGQLVISHDIADAYSPKLIDILKVLKDKQQYFAINIKADGLKDILKSILAEYHITKYFLFDMSVPQMIEFREAGLKYFTRQSEVEPVPILYEDAIGVWVDGFWSTDWIDSTLLKKHLENNKHICLVSPELHRMSDYIDFWGRIKEYKLDNNVMLCTDYPDKARSFFYD